MAVFVFFMNLLVAAFGLVFVVEISTLLIGCIVQVFEYRKGRTNK